MDANNCLSVSSSTYSFKKMKRLQSKKRKLEAYLEMCQVNDADKVDKKGEKYKTPDHVHLDVNSKRFKEHTPCSTAPHLKGADTAVSVKVLKDVGLSEIDASSSNSVLFKENFNAEKCECCSSDVCSADNLTLLRSKVRERRNLQLLQPSFYLTNVGINSQMKVVMEGNQLSISRSSSRIFAQDIQHLLLVSFAGRETPYNTRWCRLIRNKKVSHVLLLIIDGLSADLFIQNKDSFSNCTNLFSDIVEVLPPVSYGMSFPLELSNVPLSITFTSKLLREMGSVDAVISSGKAYKALSSFFPMSDSENIVNKPELENTKNFTRTFLLLSPVQMILESYPLPSDIFPGGNCDGYIFTKDSYVEVSADSPMFALDCEMCLTTAAKLEVTRVSIVDENLEVVFDSLVKPEARIVDYLTKYSGVTKSLLDPVTTTLKDVQTKIRSSLPADAILCGQSLNCDLHALKMIHPYVIDTSVIYNITGIRTKKTGLKILAQLFLGEEIQSNKNGHSPVEDSITTMKLVLLKLKNSPIFGDVILGGNIPWDNSINSYSQMHKKNDSVHQLEHKESVEKNSSGDTEPKSCVSVEIENQFERNAVPCLSKATKSNVLGCNLKQETLNSAKRSGENLKNSYPVLFSSLFKLSQTRNKNTCIIGNKEAIELYPEEALLECVKKVTVENNKMVFKRTSEEVLNHFMTVCHLEAKCDFEKQFKKLDRTVYKLYKTVADNALFIVIFSGLKAVGETFQNGLCMVTIKGNK